jgi:hypothetical protein
MQRGAGWARRLPPWPVLAALALVAALPLLSHALAAGCPPPGAVPSGLLTVDSATYLVAMRDARPPHASAYAPCGAAWGPADPRYYALPHHRLYGALGLLADALRLPHFTALALGNALATALYLLAAWALLRRAVPELARPAFLLFALGGGLGGLLYLLAAGAGWTAHPDFPLYFLRHYLYELNEGPRHQPWLIGGRLYYTLPLAMALAALALLLDTTRDARPARAAVAAVLLALAAWLNLRVGPLACGVALLLLAASPGHAGRRAGLALGMLAATLLGLAGAWRMAASNPAILEGVAGGAAWFSPLISALFPVLLVSLGFLPAWIAAGPPWARALGGAALGYLALFTLLYAGWQAYYGTWLRANDVTAALRLSDWALPGAAAGALAMLARGHRPATGPVPPPWILLWFLGLFTASFSAFGQGRFLALAPDRLVPFLGLPAAVLAAAALARLAARRPRLARLGFVAILACGGASMAVAWGLSHGPWGFDGLQRQFPWTRYASLTAHDAAVVARVRPGVVLAPALAAPVPGDYLVLRPGVRVVYGNASLDFSGEVMPEVRIAVHRFFSPGTPAPERAALIRAWCVDQVFSPDTDPPPPAVLEELRALPWLEERAAAGGAVLFDVLHDRLETP